MQLIDRALVINPSFGVAASSRRSALVFADDFESGDTSAWQTQASTVSEGVGKGSR
ncbi:MAG: hypothetical protein K8R59_14985 [Thermoanaerobaculales bacterium]|nr:hypothetical protein [Thermoanaerobaculales bacterium]